MRATGQSTENQPCITFTIPPLILLQKHIKSRKGLVTFGITNVSVGHLYKFSDFS